MKRLMIATLAGAALLAGAGAASAQGFGYQDNYYGGGGFVSAPVAGMGPGYGYGATYGSPGLGYTRATPYNSAAPRGGTYKMNVFKSQELLPQSPPEGGR